MGVGAWFQNYRQNTLMEHWDGSTWSVVPSPNEGTGGNRPWAVSALSAHDVWAVGEFDNRNPVTSTLIEHWDGSTWSVVPSPNVGSESNLLYDVSGLSPNDEWAAGSYVRDFTPETLIEHWDGAIWSVVPSSDPQDQNLLLGVTAISSTDAWVAGYSVDSLGQKLT